MTAKPTPRYVIPGDILTHMAISLMHAVDALYLVTVIAAEDPIDAERLAPALQQLNAQLGHINGALDAIVHEQNGEADGSPRLC